VTDASTGTAVEYGILHTYGVTNEGVRRYLFPAEEACHDKLVKIGAQRTLEGNGSLPGEVTYLM
jgi:hypothetical protein